LANGTALPGLFVYANSNGTYLYSVGGRGSGGSSSTHTGIYYNTIASGGAMGGSWSTANNSGYSNDHDRGFTIVGNHLYAIGGYNTSAVAQTAVDYTTINGDGTLANWQSATGLSTARGYLQATSVNGCIYAIGGKDS